MMTGRNAARTLSASISRASRARGAALAASGIGNSLSQARLDPRDDEISLD
jgi:hypothetical protein